MQRVGPNDLQGEFYLLHSMVLFSSSWQKQNSTYIHSSKYVDQSHMQAVFLRMQPLDDEIATMLILLLV